MDFFGTQDSRKKHSALLLLLFIAVLLVMAVVCHVVTVLVHIPFNGDIDFTKPTTPAKAFIALLWFLCLMGCFLRSLDVHNGGALLAKRFGAIEASTKNRRRDDQPLIDIVSEMAVASACEKPRVFILPREDAINAFVVGGFSGKEALVVTQGAIDKLNRDELTAVVAHEFGHISQGDIPLNMRLLIALGGLNTIDEVGKTLMVKSDGQFVLQPGVVVGFVIRIIGSIGVFFGRLVRSAFTRQREYLADACAVQFTRHPEHLAAALSIVRDQHDDQAIHSIHAEEIAHLCFQGGELSKWHKRVLSSHPQIQERIDAIDPHFAIKRRVKNRALEKAQGRVL